MGQPSEFGELALGGDAIRRDASAGLRRGGRRERTGCQVFGLQVRGWARGSFCLSPGSEDPQAQAVFTGGSGPGPPAKARLLPGNHPTCAHPRFSTPLPVAQTRGVCHGASGCPPAGPGRKLSRRSLLGPHRPPGRAGCWQCTRVSGHLTGWLGGRSRPQTSDRLLYLCRAGGAAPAGGGHLGASRRTLGPAYEGSYAGRPPHAAPPPPSQGLLSPRVTGGAHLVPARKGVTTGAGAGPCHS